MSTNISQDILDTVIDALSENDKEGALLLYYRASQKSLAQAWREVQTLLVDLGEEAEDLPQEAGDDPAYEAVKRYLTEPAAKRRKDTLLMAFIILVLLGVAAYLIIPNTTRLTTSIRSFFWPTTKATVLDVRTYSEGYTRGTMKFSRDYMDFLFRYEVDEQAYTDDRIGVQYYDTFGDEPFKPGDTFLIIYNPDDPAFTVYQKKIYDRLLRISIGLVCLGGGILIAAAGWSVERSRRRLRQLDHKIAISPLN